jgi:selenocysteine-specific translation elongation factor
MSKTLELVVQELQNRIGQITSNYETQLAVLKAQATEQIEDLNNRLAEAAQPEEDKKAK